MKESIVKVEHLSHRYSVQWAILDVNLDISCRGIYGLLGSNGAGKSTMMNVMCGVLKQTKGHVFIKGIDIRTNPIEAKKKLGFLPQKPPLHFDLTVEEFLTHCAGIRLIPSEKITGAVTEAMDKCGISHFAHRLIRNLSGGYQQRVGIAQAIIHNPEVIVFDEPTNGLDPNQIIEIRNLIKQIGEERTIILSTHILSEVQAVCDHIIMLEEGSIVFSGSIDEFDNYIVPNTVYVSLLQPPDLDELKRLPGVLAVDPLNDNKYRFTSGDTASLIESITQESVYRGWRMNEIRQERSSADTIFAELSKKAH